MSQVQQILLGTSNIDFISDLWGMSPLLGILGVVIAALVWLYMDSQKEQREIREELKDARKDLTESHNQRRQEALDTLEVLKGLKKAGDELTVAILNGSATISAEIDSKSKEILQKIETQMKIEEIRGARQ